MTHSYGVRACTRRKFSMGFRRHGAVRISKYLTTYKKGFFIVFLDSIGDYVDIVVDGS
jgi:large subunit ribosomal protein L21e